MILDYTILPLLNSFTFLGTVDAGSANVSASFTVGRFIGQQYTFGLFAVAWIPSGKVLGRKLSWSKFDELMSKKGAKSRVRKTR